MTLMVTTDELPAEDELQVAAAGSPGDVEETKLGIVVRDMAEEERASVDVAEQGVVVSRNFDRSGRNGREYVRET